MMQLDLVAATDDLPWPIEAFQIPPELWTVKTKTQEAIKNCGCAVCGKKPKTTDPLPSGWVWDNMEPDNNWAWCDEHQLGA